MNMDITHENTICDTDNYKQNFEITKCIQYNQYYVRLIFHYLEYLCEHTILSDNSYFVFILTFLSSKLNGYRTHSRRRRRK